MAQIKVCILLHFFLQALQGCPSHCFRSRLAKRKAVQYVHFRDRCSQIGELVSSIHALRRNINNVTLPTCDVLLRHFRNCCYMYADTRLHTLISYVALLVMRVRIHFGECALLVGAPKTGFNPHSIKCCSILGPPDPVILG